ncbi:MAG: PD40 domain-containing protein [Sedimentisphaerales bacterium]|nr:PD40 domain-containing protein [Sedimentisphaerales bacterium]
MWIRAWAIPLAVWFFPIGTAQSGPGENQIAEIQPAVVEAAQSTPVEAVRPAPIEAVTPKPVQAIQAAPKSQEAAKAAVRTDGLLETFLAGPMRGTEQIVFACRQVHSDPHWYANFGYYARDENEKLYRAGGRLCKLNLSDKTLTVLLDDPEGSVRDPQVHYDGRTILFSYRPGGTCYYHLYEIQADGTGLRQITDGPFDDIEPTYLPDGDIIFVSSRCKRWVNCWLTQVAILYRCAGDGSRLRPISSNNEQDNTPWPLPDGRILYQRWEYVDRSQVHYHHLWSCNPDGTGQMVYYGNLHPGTLMIDAKCIPGTQKVVAVFSPGHGQREHNGHITIVSPQLGPDDEQAARPISQQANLRDPYPFSEDSFLAAQGPRLVILDGHGRIEEIYRLPAEWIQQGVQCHEPRPLAARPRERLIPDRTDLAQSTGQLVLTDVNLGRRMEGIRPGQIKKLLVLETLPMPIHYTGGMQPISLGGTFTLERILGTVPVEADGSAYMEVPALRSLFFVALDENNNSVKRMQSFLTVQPGERTGCVGCHEQRTQAPVDIGRNTTLALKHPPRRIEPLAGIPPVFDFPRDIQPILDKHCVRCHGYDAGDPAGPCAGGVILTGDRGPVFSHSYFCLTVRGQIADGRNLPVSNRPPGTIGACASPLMQKIDGSHHQVRLSKHEREMIRFWIESGAAFPGTYAALGCGMIGDYYNNEQVNTDFDWPSAQAAGEAIQRRCGGCHDQSRPLPRNLSGHESRHRVWNLSRPDQSLMLLAPLARQAGGWQRCRLGNHPPSAPPAPPVFLSRQDEDYQTILRLAQTGKRHLETAAKRFDMPDFQPNRPYRREMQRYGILPGTLDADTPIDVYATDRAYWQSLWYDPAAAGGHGSD